MKTKICTKCEKEKNISEFSKDKRKSDKLSVWCKRCSNENSKNYYLKNRSIMLEKSKEYNKTYREENKEKIKELNKKYRETHKEEIKKYRKKYEESHKIDTRKSNLKCKFGMTLDDYNKKLKEQKYVCAICGQKETAIDSRYNKIKLLAVDHNHETGQIRELLCNKCNHGLGCFKDNIDILNNAIKYLKEH